ncbi:murein L,D-transpeptidase family protein [Pseudoruegeria sp. SK021]|uniref:L,D-transpeptidase family protein n=1 Tax=Pseudoruegeria sp. SK021 TaxID=1933035 RepID=UPI000A22D572|nr:L,D-transpeptidase family protein [Pseudoruegeria sp. SK021]OSP54631.1 hypothetical protein BV911_11560 [Pseudoruegeria sp. SK021]
MRAFIYGILVVAGLAVAGCGRSDQSGQGGNSKFKAYRGPEVTQLYVSKERRKLYLLSGIDVIKTYDMDLGFAPDGPKTVRGDGRTPEGYYLIDRRNPNSQFHLSIGISYPNQQDVAKAEAAGVDPGGDIFIHGEAKRRTSAADWTAGCIAVTNAEMEEIYAMVKDGTPIYIAP